MRKALQRLTIVVFAGLLSVLAPVSLLQSNVAAAEVAPQSEEVKVAQAGSLGLGSLLGGVVPTTCALETIGWLMCPVLRTAAKIADFGFSFISGNFIGFEVTLFAQGSGTEQAWAVMRNVANVLFVVLCLVVVYSLITGRGVDNYNIKRILPRFLLIIILVNISYYACIIAVDAFSVIGSSISTALVGISSQINNVSGMPYPIDGEAGSDNAAVLIYITNAILGNAATVWVLLAPLSAVVFAAAIICAVIIVLLIIRKTLIVTLILLAPIALAMYALPNTERFFRQWSKMFLHVLMIFPVIAILLGAGQIVSASIIKAGDLGYYVDADLYVPKNELMPASSTLRLIAAGTAILPLLGTWFVFKSIMSFMDTAAARVARSGGRPDEAKKLERSRKRAEDGNKSLLSKGLEGLDRIRAAEGSSGGLIPGRRNRRKSSKTLTPEEEEFNSRVQGRLKEIRNDPTDDFGRKLSPEEVYQNALDRYNSANDAVTIGSSDGLNINSYEGIDLKASEAYLLENLGRGTVAAAGAFAVAGKEEDKKKEATSHYDKDKLKDNKPGHNSGGGGGGGSSDGGSGSDFAYNQAIGRRSAGGVKVAAVGSTPASRGENQTIIVQGPITPDAAPMAAPAPRHAPTQTELKAKERALKFVEQSQEAAGLNNSGLFDKRSSKKEPKHRKAK